MATRPRTTYVCDACGAAAPKWMGQCPDCRAWDSMQEVAPMGSPGRRVSANQPVASVQSIENIELQSLQRFSSGFAELDRVLGGGLVAGSAILVGGDPGIGKSTILLQALAAVSADHPVLYVSGEESAQQMAGRAQRLRLASGGLRILAETRVQQILPAADSERPTVMVLDSIQTFHTDWLQSAPGSVSQVRDCAAEFVRYAKSSGCCVVLVGHVTKEGFLAGPRVLEHLVDTVLYFEGDDTSRFRLIRAVKNRFGAINEIGVFAMTDAGLREVNNPSAMFVHQNSNPGSGSIVFATQQGSRPLLVEVQALVDASVLANPRRLAVGIEQTRLGMLLAVMHRHAGISLHDQDVFVNIVGGIRVIEPAADLATVLAIASSYSDQVLPPATVAFGEVGLAGEVRPVQNGLDRLREAQKLGFKRAIIAEGNRPKEQLEGLEVTSVRNIGDALRC
ncbi:MAG: DNA repair protein RadA [Gammaproteobacteria bacterium]|nr:DNA repair protein RadA [Gammaproteobacteria bacterium]